MEEIQQLQRRVNEQVLERAEADPQWKQQFLKDPQTAMGEMPEAKQLQEMYESARPTEAPPDAPMPPSVQEEYRSLAEKMLDKAASDPIWKQQLLDDPEAALQEGGFLPKYQRLEEIRQQENTEVSGHFTGQEHGTPNGAYTFFCTFQIDCPYPKCRGFSTLIKY
jgi:hypothetical protein